MMHTAEAALPTDIVAQLVSARDSIVATLAAAHAADTDCIRARSLGRDSSEEDLKRAELIALARARISQAVDLLEQQRGSDCIIGVKASHFAGEIRNAQQALAIADVQASRLNFVVNAIT